MRPEVVIDPSPNADEPEMQQISVRFLDPEIDEYIKRRIREAVAAERERCREQEVKPLIACLKSLREYKVWNGEYFDRPLAGEIDAALVAVEAVQKEQPNG